MSYARFNQSSDVYVFLHVDGFLECCGCAIHFNSDDSLSADPNEFPHFYNTANMIAHLEKHKKLGHKVANYTLEALKLDSAKNNAWIKSMRKKKK